MISTNYQVYQSDLQEVLNEFVDFSGQVCVNGQIKDENFLVDVSVLEKSYSYQYLYCPNTPLEEKRLQKRFLKLSLYKSLVSYTGESLPWGALTGIRPTKLAYQQDENFEDFFLNTMLVSKEKTQLIAKILNTQKGIYNRDSNNKDLFISVPFCPSRCEYCSFISNEIGKEPLINEYIDALIYEIEASKAKIDNIRSVYIGGGTPVSLSDDLFYKLLNGIGKQNVEYTIEAGRPDAITQTKLEMMKEFNVTRVCVNPQTFNDKTLIKIGRRHTANDIMEKYRMVKDFGFDVNMDLIAGLTGETFEDFKYSVDTAISLNPENITVHTLSLKAGSILKETVHKLTDKEVSLMVEYAHNALAKAGYNPYYLYRQKYMAGNLENTGYAKPNKECVYNIDIMEETTDILANGANAVSKKVGENGKITRIGAPKNTQAYLSKVETLIKEKNLLF